MGRALEGNTRYGVIQWATGRVGRHTLRTIIEHPRLELAALWVSSEEKAGQDVSP